MSRLLRVCLALCAALGLAAAKPRPAAKPQPAALKANGDVPPPGAAAELLDLATGRSRAVGPMLESLTEYQATAMADGRVLITGGSLQGPRTQWFDPGTRAFTPGPPMTIARQGHRALLLKDGRLLLLGGTEAPAPAEVLAPGAARFEALPAEAAFGLSADAVALDDGKALLVDGASGRIFTWDGRKTVRPQATLSRPRIFFTAVRLKDGRVAITGGWPSEQAPRKGAKGRGPSGPGSPSLPVECFNPKWSTLSTWKALPRPRARHRATLLADGRICLWAGYGADVNGACETLELLDPVKETVTPAGRLPLNGNPTPAWTLGPDGSGLYLPEGRQELRAAADPLALTTPGEQPGLKQPGERLAPMQTGERLALTPPGEQPALTPPGEQPALTPLGGPRARLANAFLAPTLVALPAGQVLVLGSAAWGVPVDRWDPRTRQWSIVGSLRAGVQSLALTPDGKLLALGPIVDLLDPRTGAQQALGWREDLGPLLRTAHAPEPLAPAQPPFKAGQGRQDSLVVPLDKLRALVVGGCSEGTATPSGAAELWDRKKNTLSALPGPRTHRAFPASGLVQGGLKLPDGSVLVWGAGQE